MHPRKSKKEKMAEEQKLGTTLFGIGIFCKKGKNSGKIAESAASLKTCILLNCKGLFFIIIINYITMNSQIV